MYKLNTDCVSLNTPECIQNLQNRTRAQPHPNAHLHVIVTSMYMCRLSTSFPGPIRTLLYIIKLHAVIILYIRITHCMYIPITKMYRILNKNLKTILPEHNNSLYKTIWRTDGAYHILQKLKMINGNHKQSFVFICVCVWGGGGGVRARQVIETRECGQGNLLRSCVHGVGKNTCIRRTPMYSFLYTVHVHRLTLNSPQ